MDSNKVNCLETTGNLFRGRCRICLLSDEEAEKRMVSNICDCKGAAGNVHVECLAMWINVSQRDHCELCLRKINIVKSPKFNVLSSVLVFIYLNRASQILLLMIVFGLILYVSSIWYIDRLLLKPQSFVQKVCALIVNFAVFTSVFIISYSPLICLYLWDQWKEWRGTQYYLEIQPSLVNV